MAASLATRWRRPLSRSLPDPIFDCATSHGKRVGAVAIVRLPTVFICGVQHLLHPRLRLPVKSYVKETVGKACGIMASRAGHWSNGLLASMNDPEMILESDDKVVIIKDKYPKAKYHFLIMPKEQIQSLKSVKPSQIDLLRHMHKMGEEIAQRADKDLQFRLGYHAVPSMSHLHLHVISQDFNSPCLKTKKHWNSFTTEYFVDSEDVIEAISSHGKWVADSEKCSDLLKKDLRCHVCKKTFPTIPSLKAHIVLHDVAAFKSSS